MDRRSEMAQRQLRRRVGLVTTGLASAALLVGPVASPALDATGVTGSGGTTNQLGATTESVATTVQTAPSTVTNVESTVQTTAQTTTQAVVQTTQTATSQVQSSDGTVTAAP